MNLPEGLTHIGNGAFQICSGLTSITFPKSLEHIGPYAFSDCTGIRELYFLGDAPTFNTYCFGSVTATGYYKANRAGWDDITSLYLGGNITWVGLTSITLGALSPISTSVGETVTLQLDAKGDDLKFIWYLGDSQIGTGNPLVFTADSNMNGKELYCVVSNPEGESATSNKVTITVYDSLQEDVSRTLGIDYDQYLYLLFTPKITCVYSFIATDAEILSAGLSIPHGEEFTYASFTETGFELTYKLEAGQPYILRIFSANSSYRALDFKLVVTRTHGNLNENITKPATCTENGKVTYTCGYCNHTWQDIIPAGHNYVNGTCINCSKEEPVASGDLTDTCWWELCGNTLYIYGTGAMPNYEIFFHQPWYNYQPQIQKILVAEGITSVGVYAFSYCNKVTSVSLPVSLESIGDYGFQNCRGLETINLGDLTKLTSIGSYCFYSCNELKEIIILGNVKQLGEFAFCSCSAVTRVEFLGSAPSMDTTPFMGVYADAWHPVNDPSWTADVRSLHQTLRWQVDAYSGENPGGNENPGGDAPEGDLLRGDVDCNGKIDTDDVVALLLYLTMTDMFQLKPGVDVDLDKNGIASTDDAIALLLHISLPDLFPI